MTRMIDLHVHTTASDGTYTPTETVNLAKKAGLAALAITDHDTVNGVEEAVNAAKGSDIELVPGVEIGVGDTDNIHIIGLYVDIYNKDFRKVMDTLKNNRRERNLKIISNLKDIGYDISYSKVEKEYNTKNIGRLHIAQYLQNKCGAGDYRNVLKRYLIPGKKTYVPKKNLSEQEGIDVILKSGGIPVLAHINYLDMDKDGVENTVKRLVDYGLKGVEAYYSGYDSYTQNMALEICEKFNLIKSGGTDFHGARRYGVYLGTGRGNMCVPYELLLDIKKML